MLNITSFQMARHKAVESSLLIKDVTQYWRHLVHVRVTIVKPKPHTTPDARGQEKI